ncbi:CxC2-like cysteine cluster KDZ transposase-associated domain-containing protein [Pleurotus pulmonarius]
MRRPKRLAVHIDAFEDEEDDMSQPTIHRHTDMTIRNNGMSTKRFFYTTMPTPMPNTSQTPTPLVAQPEDQPMDDSFPSHDDESNYVTYDGTLKTRLRKRTFAADNPMLVWMQERDEFLQEFLRLEAPEDQEDEQVGCSTSECPSTGLFRCPQCFDCRLFCQTCIVNRHQASPFHVVEEWNSQFFERCSLQSLGLSIQLGHPLGVLCPNPTRTYEKGFTVITSHGIVVVTLRFCDCGQAASRSVQLLRARLFPATTIDPHTAATFEVLRLFQLLTFGSKVSGFEFYTSLVRLTDNLGEHQPDRYNAFMRMVRQWRHIRMMKRAGRGHASSGVLGTNEGECAVLCPACPHPGKNLPSDWNSAPASKGWIYSLFLAIDANFRLKRLSASDDSRDPGLHTGFAYFVEEKKYKQFLTETTDLVSEPSTCSNYDAVKSASLRGGKGVTASGVGTIECSRHDMKRPLSVGDLQRGERYANMDYLYFSSITNHSPAVCVVSYDIACQWTRNMGHRATVYPPEAVGTQYHSLSIRYLVPKFHLYAHRSECQNNYSFNFTPHVGRTDGESPERGWAAMNPVSSSTKEMGPGSRRDTLDDHFGDYNWRKISSMHTTLLRRLQEAIPMRSEHVSAFLEFSKSLPSETTRAFSQMIWDFESGKSATNPYEATLAAESQSKVRLALAEEDAAEIARDEALSVHTTVSPSVLIQQGLELEDQQARLANDAKALGISATEQQRSQLIERRSRLQRRIVAWSQIQSLYMPGVASLRSSADESSSTPAESVQLFLPSAVIASISCNKKLAGYEWRLRYGLAFDCLAELRRHLLVLNTMYQSKDQLIRGQHHNTRSNTLIQGVQTRIKYISHKYRTSRSALASLSQPLRKDNEWESMLRPLLDTDIRGLREGEDASSTSEGRRQLSWIWSSQRTNAAELTLGMNEALRIEWCKARARAQRWQEECMLLWEEMRRVIEFHKLGYGRRALMRLAAEACVDIGQSLKTGEGAAAAGEQLVECCTRT